MYFTPLDVAAENGNKKTVEILLDHGASISGGDDTVNKIFFEQIISAKKILPYSSCCTSEFSITLSL